MRNDTGRTSLRILVGALVLIFVATTWGCEPLRKKFRREKKKKDDVRSNPVLDPIDYAPQHTSPQERYQYHYSMWNVWEREFMKAVDEKAPTKRFKYLTGQLTSHLGEMTKWLEEPKGAELQGLLEKVRKVEEEWDRPEGMRNMYSIKLQVEQIDKKVRNNFHPKKLLEYKQSVK